MAQPEVGDKIGHPKTGKKGRIVAVECNPACGLRTLTVAWEDGEVEEHTDLELNLQE